MPQSIYNRLLREQFWSSDKGQAIMAVFYVSMFYMGSKAVEFVLWNMPV